MSTPAAATEKTPAARVVCPARAGPPTSCAVHVGFAVKVTPGLAWPPTVTTTFPVVAPLGTTRLVLLQLVGAAAIPLKVTVLVPCVAPKLAPTIVTGVPTGPIDGFRLVRVGAG